MHTFTWTNWRICCKTWFENKTLTLSQQSNIFVDCWPGQWRSWNKYIWRCQGRPELRVCNPRGRGDAKNHIFLHIEVFSLDFQRVGPNNSRGSMATPHQPGPPFVKSLDLSIDIQHCDIRVLLKASRPMWHLICIYPVVFCQWAWVSHRMHSNALIICNCPHTIAPAEWGSVRVYLGITLGFPD